MKKETDERTAYALIHAQEKCAYALALSVTLAWYLFVVWEYRGCAAKVDEKIAALEALHVTGHNVPFALTVFSDDARAFRLTDLLHDDLLRGLRGDAAEILARLERE